MEREKIVIEGYDFSTLEEFYGVIGQAILGPNYSGYGNLDWLNDVLFLHRHETGGSYTFIWRHSSESRQRLGYSETVRQLEQRKVPRFPFGTSGVVSDLEQARQGKGPTVFDWLVEVIERSGDFVHLRLE